MHETGIDYCPLALAELSDRDLAKAMDAAERDVIRGATGAGQRMQAVTDEASERGFDGTSMKREASRQEFFDENFAVTLRQIPRMRVHAPELSRNEFFPELLEEFKEKIESYTQQARSDEFASPLSEYELATVIKHYGAISSGLHEIGDSEKLSRKFEQPLEELRTRLKPLVEVIYSDTTRLLGSLAVVARDAENVEELSTATLVAHGVLNSAMSDIQDPKSIVPQVGILYGVLMAKEDQLEVKIDEVPSIKLPRRLMRSILGIE